MQHLQPQPRAAHLLDAQPGQDTEHLEASGRSGGGEDAVVGAAGHERLGWVVVHWVVACRLRRLHRRRCGGTGQTSGQGMVRTKR